MAEEENTSEGRSKGYEPAAIERKWYEKWKADGVFKAKAGTGKPPYCITIPPPNVTGSLHMGHALNNSILDSMTRWHRMRGFEALCIPGTDHAGIATQNVVERDLAKEGLTRQEVGREAFIERCWKWREQYGNRIYFQFESLGCSYDWDRVRFTMDQSYVDAIIEEFRSWYERGLIYRGTRVVNWDVKFQSAVSDIEVVTEERKGKLYHFRYPFADGSGYITIATTRPETLLGDAAVAANPNDERYQPHFGKLLALPLTDRQIPLIADDYAKPEFGSGAVKVTPAHDLNDFECGVRHGLPQHVVIGKNGAMTELAGPEFVGLDRFVARTKVVELMEALGLLEKVEDYKIQTPLSDRSKEVIEPLLSEQWFVDMKPLAEPAIQVVKEGKIRFIPDRYTDIYLQWMENIRPWCISRQLWWGHRIPVWWAKNPDGTLRHAFARNRDEAIAALGAEDCWQDEDVLDTWFSSALWPHACLGWPSESSDDLDFFYPTDLLSTAQEILYLWVARMIMTGLDFVKRPISNSEEAQGLLDADGEQRSIIPFKDVYIHATVLDEKGRRMSKSLGNGIDPIDLIERYGADATRFSLMQQAGKNQDIKYSEQRTDIAGNFCNKLWNASRFVLMHLDVATTGQLPDRPQLSLADRWILSRLTATIEAVNASLAQYDMDDATRALYQFFWNDFCDWYVELAKPRLRAEEADPAERSVAQNMLAYVLEVTLRLLHPIIPFITEEIWQSLPHSGETICTAPYPEAIAEWKDADAEAAIGITIDATRAFRNLRSELGISPAPKLQAAVVAGSGEALSTLTSNRDLIAGLARLSSLTIVDSAPDATSGVWIGSPISGAEVFLEIGETVDLKKERDRIDKELASIAKEIERSEGKLANPNFVERANPEVVEKERSVLADWQEKQAKLTERRKVFSGS